MAQPAFVHLRTHSAYSLAEGAIRNADLAKRCVEWNMPAVAVTDTNNLFGAMEFGPAMMKAGVQPIIGCQLNIGYGTGLASGGARVRPGQAAAPDIAPIVLLAQTETGYGNLLKLISSAFQDSDPMFDPHVPTAMLTDHAEGVICLTGGAAGPMGMLLQNNLEEEARAWFQQIAGVFGDRTYVELQRHGWSSEDQVEDAMIDMAFEFGQPLVATNDCFFLDEGMYEAHDALICVAEGAYVSQDERRRLTPEHRFRPAEEMAELFKDLPEAIDSTTQIARRCGYAAPYRGPILPRFETEGGRSEADELRAMSERGLKDRLEAIREAGGEPDEQAYIDRLNFELDVIIKMDFPGYFLIVADFIQWTKGQDIPVGPGRGSGAGSLVAYVLTITDLDPIRHQLLFERFLNPERVSMPDFDIDFCQDRRDEVISYVQDKYGHDKVAQIITFGKLQARAVIRDVGRVLQMPYGQVDRISKLVPSNPANPITLQQALDTEDALKEQYRSEDSVKRLVDLALQLEGLYRHASTHAAGVVIVDRALDELVPLYRDPKSDMPVTQFSMKYVESAGLVKFDFLGLKTLTVLTTAVKHVADGGVDLDLAKLPEQDEKTFAMLGRGDTVGVFQLESSGMRDVLRQMKPDKFDDIIAIVALYRPGPMDNIPKYIATKHGREEAEYPHEMLKPVLEETYGIAVYQEQVMQIAQVLSGYSLGEADLLRRAMGKKIPAEMEKQKARFIEGAGENGVKPGHAADIFVQVEKFAGYGFNKSHAAAYALVAWQTAYLKANYPAEFLAASMTLDKGNTDKLDIFKGDLKRLDIKLLPPDVNRSEVDFSVERDNSGTVTGVRYALSAVKNVGTDAMKAIVDARNDGGPFLDMFDFVTRVDVTALNKRQLENLTRAGAFDALNSNRHQVKTSVETLTRYAQQKAMEQETGQGSLFGGATGNEDRPPLSSAHPWNDHERLTEERSAIGFYLSGHPLDDCQRQLRQKNVGTIDEVPGRVERGESGFRVAGSIMAVQIRKAQASGRSYAYLSLSDPSGEIELMAFSDKLEANRHLLESGRNVMCAVEILRDREEPTFAIVRMELLEDFIADAVAGARIMVNDPAAFPAVKSVLDRVNQGRGVVKLLLRPSDTHHEVIMNLPGGYTMDRGARQSLKSLPGVMDVQEI